MLRMATDGIGIGVLPLDLVARDLAEGRLVRLDVPPLLAPLRFTASYVATPDSRLAETVALLASEIAEESLRDKPALSRIITTSD
jgi:DNA-binding transcriptional LysR family regulator